MASKERESSAQSLRLPKIQNQALLSGLAYCISSCSMILVNKFVLSVYGFSAPVFFMLYQNIVSVTIVSTLSLSGAVPTEPLTWNNQSLVPVNIIFYGMLITSMFSLKYVNVAMLTILKNVANVPRLLLGKLIFSRSSMARKFGLLFPLLESFSSVSAQAWGEFFGRSVWSISRSMFR